MGCTQSVLKRSEAERPKSMTVKKQDSSSLLRTIQLTDDEIELPRLGISLSLLATVYTDEVRRNTIINETPGWRIFGILEWESESSPETQALYGHPYALTGLVTHQIDTAFKNIPFVAFRGDFCENKTNRALQRAKGEFIPEAFLTSKGHKLGLANKPMVEMYCALRATGMVDSFMDLCKRKPAILIVGHGTGGALASLLATELAVDNSNYFTKNDANSNNAANQQTDANKKAVKDKVGEVNLYSIPKMEILTFGSPRVFAKNTARKLRMMHFHERFVRFINAGDVIPTLCRGEAEHLGEVCCYRKRPVLAEDKAALSSTSTDSKQANDTANPDPDEFIGWWIRYKSSFPDFDYDQWLDARVEDAFPTELELGHNDILQYVDALIAVPSEEDDDDVPQSEPSQSVQSSPRSPAVVDESGPLDSGRESVEESLSMSMSMDAGDLTSAAVVAALTSASTDFDSSLSAANAVSSPSLGKPKRPRPSSIIRVQYGGAKKIQQARIGRVTSRDEGESVQDSLMLRDIVLDSTVDTTGLADADTTSI